MADRAAPGSAGSGPKESGDEQLNRNEVKLVGRLAARAEVRALPSGDQIVVLRLIVGRPRGGPERSDGRRTSAVVDTLDCTAWRANVRRTAMSWVAGDVVEVTGSLRRRFWRGAAGPASRCDVEVTRARRVRRAA